jgi:predicted acyltransferase
MANLAQPDVQVQPDLARTVQVRLLSLDAFRGVTMAAMVIVNNPGDWGNVYAPLLHAEWNGWTPTDTIFPFFLFIVGVSITLSRSTMGSWGRIARRAAVIFGLGLFLAAFPRFPFATLRIPGVLQRIAVCYLAAAIVFRTSRHDTERQRTWRIGAWIGALLLGYWGVMTLVPVPGGTTGDLTPSGNLGAWLDRALMQGHLWKPTWDPEGVLSTVPAIGTTLCGVVAGIWLRARRSPEQKAVGLAMAGIVLLAAGEMWGLAFPINKGLWTSSYVIFMAGAASLLLAACYWVIDVRGFRAWSAPFVILGLNAITLFVLSGLLAKTLNLIRVPRGTGSIALKTWIYGNYIAPFASPKNASLAYAAANLVVLFAVLYLMYRRRIFLKA